MQPHLTSYHSGLLTKTPVFFPHPPCTMGDCMICFNLARVTMKPQCCCMMYGVNVTNLLKGKCGSLYLLCFVFTLVIK